MREEGLLKLFFAGALPPEEAVEILRAMRAHRLAVNAQLRAMEPDAAEKEDPFPLLVLRSGIEFTDWFADWCERMEAQILASAPEKRSSLMFDALARLADGNARRDRPRRDRLLPARRRARRLGRRAASTPTAPTTRRPRPCRPRNACRTPGCACRR